MVFLIIGLIGLALLLVSFLFDGVLDFLHFDVFDNGMLSLTALAGFVALFGFTGYLCEINEVATPTTVIVAALAGAVGFLVTGFSMNYLRKQSQDGSIYDSDNLIDRVATVVSGAPAGSYATVYLVWNGIPHNMSAICDEPLKEGQMVAITQVISSSSVRVEKVQQ